MKMCSPQEIDIALMENELSLLLYSARLSIQKKNYKKLTLFNIT